jgi:fluoride exporter
MTQMDDEPTERPLPRLGLSPATIFAIALGGALGTVARFLLDNALTVPAGHFPSTTLLINLSGSLAIGLLIPLVDRAAGRAPLVRPFLIVGVLGGWTTYSTFAVDATTLIKNGHATTSILYLAATVFGGLGCVLVGQTLARRVSS